jgi:hypothetical protein
VAAVQIRGSDNQRVVESVDFGDTPELQKGPSLSTPRNFSGTALGHDIRLTPGIGRFNFRATNASRRRALNRAAELKYAPYPLTARTFGLKKLAVRKFRNHARPELTTMMVILGHADNPPRGKETPQQKRCLPTYAAATIPTNDEELSNIEYVGVIGRWGSTRDQCESGKPVTASDQEREPPIGLRPI